MNVLILTNSKLDLGAGVFAKDLAKMLIRNNFYVKIMVNQYSGEKDHIVNVQSDKGSRAISILKMLSKNKYLKSLISSFAKSISKAFKLSNGHVFKVAYPSKYVVQDIDQTKGIYDSRFLFNKLKGFKPDAIVVLFTQNYLNYKNLSDFKSYYKSPIFISMVDSSPITGGCHYSWECEGYQKLCKHCPAVPDHLSKYIERNLAFKKRIYSKERFQYIYGSSSQKLELDKSAFVQSVDTHQIHIPIDETIFNNDFKVREKTREILGFTENEIVFFFGAMNTKDPRKGVDLLSKALKSLLSENIKNFKILIIGKESEIFKDFVPKKMLVTLPAVAPYELFKYYNAADIFISPSIEDAGPMMVNQSIMCGTRVVAFNVGVAVDFIKSGSVTGRICKNISADSLRDTLIEEFNYQKENNQNDLREFCYRFANQTTSNDAVGKKWSYLIKSHIV